MALPFLSNNHVTRRTGVDYHDIELFKDVNPLDWEDWHWQMRNRIRTKEALAKVINLTKEEELGIKKSSGKLGLAITPHLATLMDPNDPNCPIRRQFVSLGLEFQNSPHEMSDPCAEDRDSPVPGLVHRYPDRVLFLATESCAAYCRHCTRRRLVGDKSAVAAPSKFDQAFEYIKANRKIRDVLISGGDPFMLMDAQPNRRIFLKHSDKILGYSLGQAYRNARSDTQQLHMRNSTKILQDFLQVLILKHKGVAA